MVALPLLALLSVLAQSNAARALTPISVTSEDDRIEITTVGDIYDGRGDNLQVETAPGADGTTGRMSVRATTAGTNPGWIVFALQNDSDKPIERWLTAERYNVVGSGVIWPDLDARRIEAVTPSVGFLPERVKNDRADIFRLTIEPGQTITYAAELASDRPARVYLWKALEYEQKTRDRQLFNGVMLGITGLLAIFLTAVFAANPKIIFPSTALVTWCVLALLCVDFGYWHTLFQMRPDANAQYRAAAEASVAASLVIFLFTFLRVNLWHGFARMLFAVWIAAQLAIIATAVLDPRLAATIARMSLAAIGVVGALLALFLALRGMDRALALLPTWILFLVWLFGAGVTVTGRLATDLPIFGLLAGLVFIVLLMGFTVTQFAFRSVEPMYGASPTEQQLRSLAIESAGVAVWEWSARRNEIRVDPTVEATLGLSGGVLSAKVDSFLTYLHPADKERFQLMLLAAANQDSGALRLQFRLRHADSSYRWFDLDGASVPTSDRRLVRCVGLLWDVTDERRAQERLMHDAVHDSLTGLPNRELCLDRLNVSLLRAKTDALVRPTLIYCDLDRFKSVNNSFGLVVGDSLLLTISRRLSRALSPEDTLARLGGDQFVIFLPAAREPRDLVRFADRVRQALRSPIRIAGQEIVLTGAIGVAVYDGSQEAASDLLREAEIAMNRAKRSGSDRVEIFKPEMNADNDQRAEIQVELRKAIDARELDVLYQPIIALSTEELVGFEALVRWQHPRLGQLSPAEFVPVAEQTDLIVRLGSYVLGRAVSEIARWQKELPRIGEPLFMSVNVSSRQLITPDLIQEVRHVIGRNVLARGSLRLEITESLVMENPEQASQVLDLLKDVGAGLAMDDFGAGYSSLSYLQRFPFDVIKIDRSLVHASDNQSSGSVIMRSVVAMAHELGKKVVAEGVETAEEASFLRSLGCEYAQGFYYGEPMSARDVLHLLRLVRKSDRRMRRRGLVRGPAKKRSAETAVTQPDSAPQTDNRRPGRQRPGAPMHPAASGRGRTASPVKRTPTRVVPSTARTGPPTQPVLQQPPVPLGLKQGGRVRSAAANARARLAGLAGHAPYHPPEPDDEALLKPMPSTPPRRGEAQTNNGAAASVQHDQATAVSDRPPPLPHQMVPSDKARTVPQRQATAPNVTRPPNLDALPPAIKASLEKLAGGTIKPDRRPPDGNGGADR